MRLLHPELCYLSVFGSLVPHGTSESCSPYMIFISIYHFWLCNVGELSTLVLSLTTPVDCGYQGAWNYTYLYYHQLAKLANMDDNLDENVQVTM